MQAVIAHISSRISSAHGGADAGTFRFVEKKAQPTHHSPWQCVASPVLAEISGNSAPFPHRQHVEEEDYTQQLVQTRFF